VSKAIRAADLKTLLMTAEHQKIRLVPVVFTRKAISKRLIKVIY